MRTIGVEAAIARFREAGTKKYAHNRNCAQRGSAYLGVLLYPTIFFVDIRAAYQMIRQYNGETDVYPVT